MSDEHGLTHLDPDGAPRMVDVGEKPVSRRTAVAEGTLVMSQEAFERVRSGTGPKGDVLQVARLGGIMGGKRTGDLIPLCHVLPGASISVDIEPDATLPGLVVRARAVYAGKTGVEMEALVAASLSLLTAYDMVKAVDKGMVIRDVRLMSKSGGTRGEWRRPP